MSEHIVPRRIYVAVFLVLLCLTAITVAASRIDLGPMNAVVALTIAVTKAVLVVLFFMHLKYSSRLTWLVLGSGIVWLAILIGITLCDYRSREWLNPTTVQGSREPGGGDGDRQP